MDERIDNCICCAKNLSGEEEKRRRLLSNPNMQPVLESATSMIIEFLGSVEGVAVDLAKLHAGYICRSCVGLVEKYQELHQQLKTKL